jgi:putative transposase
MIDKEHQLPITKQCHILQLSRSSFYYVPAPVCDNDRELMHLIDEIHLEEPLSRFTRHEKRIEDAGPQGRQIQVRTLIWKMGIEILYKKPRLSKPHPGHTVYPYLVRSLDITEANAVWCSDITSIPMAKGFCYLVAVMDWVRRKVLSWRLSNTLDTSFCVEALEEALQKYGTPGIFNTDQGSQFTSSEFTNILTSNGIKISMDGNGRLRHNVFIERLWKTVKYQEVYLKAYESISYAKKELTTFFDRYNMRQPHQGLEDRTPDEVYFITLSRLKDAV